jgi:hypothetical protein
MKTTQSELINMFGNRIKIVNKEIGSYGSTFNVTVNNLDQEILDKINQFMSEKGWFPTNIGFSGLKGRIYSQNVNNYLGEDEVQITYESNSPDAIKVNQNKAYHVTPDIFFNQVNEKGIVPKSESKLSNHPDRVYLYRNQDEHNSIVWALWNSLSKERQKTIKNYHVLEIDLTQIPNHQFFNDPQSMPIYGAMYTTQPIPKSAIKVIGKIDTKDIESKDEVEMSKEEEKIARDEIKQKEKERIDREKQQEKSDLENAEYGKKFDELPDNLKNMDINDLLSLEEQIRKVVKEEIHTKVSNHDYSNLIKKTVLNYVDFDICKMVVDKLDDTKDQYYVIMMVDEPLRSDYREKLQDFLNEFIPLTIYVSIADGMGCKKFMEVEHPKQLSESKIPTQVLRRHGLIDDTFKIIRSRFAKRICDYRHPDHFLDTIYERTLEDLYHAWFYETVSDDEWDVASEYIQKYLKDEYEKSTVMYWENECKRKNPLRKEEEMKEGLHDTSWENDEGDKITLIDLLNATEDIPVERVSVEELKPHLLSWDGDEEEIIKIDSADLQYPILIFVDNDGEFISIIDGHHRAQKAVRKGLKTIKAKVIPINDLPKDIRKVFSHMGRQEEMKEEELTEKCWKGYTQKGMKTMFGKRYPNCVKKKK